jgi:hypothetical protein
MAIRLIVNHVITLRNVKLRVSRVSFSSIDDRVLLTVGHSYRIPDLTA